MRGRGQDEEFMGPPQDKRGRGQDKEVDDNDDMEISHPVEEKRKRQRNTEKTETVTKKIKDNNDDNDLDLTSDTKPILSIGLVPPSDEVIEIEKWTLIFGKPSLI